MRYFALTLIAFVSITAVLAQNDPMDTIDYIFHCAQKYNTTCAEYESCTNMMYDINLCFYKYCFRSYNQSYPKMHDCFNQECTYVAKNSQNPDIQYYTNKFSECLNSGIIQFAFVLLITILSAIIVQY
ncbi:hypothetical protein ABPG74_019840 [Tetrahymena malaccensis]